MRNYMLGAGLVVVMTATAAYSQTNDHFYRSWAWTAETGTARAAGLGGAVVALSNDGAAPLNNPAGLTTLRKTEIVAGALMRQSGTTDIGDEVDARTGLGAVSGGGLITPRWAIGAYVSEPHAINLTLSPTVLKDGSVDTGYLRTIVTEAGGAVAWKVGERMHLGARVTVTHLEGEGSWSRTDSSGANDILVGTSSNSSRVVASFGAIYIPSEKVRLGALLQSGASYEMDRNARSPSLGLDLEFGGTYDLRQPAKASAGVAFIVSPQITVVGQLDYVRYSEIKYAFRQGTGGPGDYSTENAVEPRAGVELSLPLASEISLQARAGIHSEAFGGATYVGGDATEASAWLGGDRTLRVSGGLSLVTQSLDVGAAIVTGRVRSALVATASVRF